MSIATATQEDFAMIGTRIATVHGHTGTVIDANTDRVKIEWDFGTGGFKFTPDTWLPVDCVKIA